MTRHRSILFAAAIGLALPIKTWANTTRMLRLEVSYSGTAAFFNLYKNGELACSTASADTPRIDCPVEIEPTPMTFVLTAVDDEGTESPPSAPYIFVPPAAPKATFTANAKPRTVPATVSFDASNCADFDGMIVRYLWDFGDGTSGTGKFIDHAYTTPGAYVARLTVFDDDGHSTEMKDQVIIAPPALTAAKQAVSTPEDRAHIGIVPSASAAGAPLTFSLVSPPLHGALKVFNPGTGAYIYTPRANFSGADYFTFTANNGIEDSPLTTVNLTVTPVNDPPKAASDSVQVRRGNSAIIPALANDSDLDGDALTVVAISQPRSGKAQLVNGEIRYTAPSLPGQTMFSYRIIDGKGGTAIGSVKVTVTQ